MHKKRDKLFPYRPKVSWTLVVTLFSQLIFALAEQVAIEPSLIWKQEIVPLFDQECIKCHGPLRKKGGLDLSTFQSLTRGSDSGTILQPGSPTESKLFQVIQSGADPHMPPKKQLSQESIDLLEHWITHLPIRPNPSELKLDSTAREATGQSGPLSQAPLAPSLKTLPAHQVINHFIRTEWQSRNLIPASPSDDRTFIRRVYLDLIGRGPSPTEITSFLFDGSPEKRSSLVQQLLSRQEFDRNMAENLNLFLLGRKGKRAQTEREKHGWMTFLEQALATNRPWNEVIRDVILARQPEASPQRKSPEDGALWFVYEHRDNHQLIAESIAPIVFGTQIKCAQCHDHPLAHEIKQAHYWGVVAAFNRSKNIKTESGLGVAESAIGGFINFANLEQESQAAKLVFLNGKSIDEARPESGAKEMDSPKKYAIAPPEKDQPAKRAAIPLFSRREQLAKATTEENPLLARAFVNYLWALFLGRGIVHPFDEMNSKYPPSHPELLHWLGEHFESTDFNVKGLIGEILASEVYQLSSKPNSKHLQHRDAFPSALERPIKAETLYRQLLHSTGHDEAAYVEAFPDQATTLKEATIQQFPNLIPVEYQATLQQAMFLSNSPEIDHLLVARPGNTAHRLLSIADMNERIRETFTAILNRFPDPLELEYVHSYLTERSSSPEAALKQLMWSLIASPEFQLNR